jgi:hypothetical protein
MKYITAHPMTKERLRVWAADSEVLVPSLFFWKHGTTDRLRSSQGMMRSLLWQIVCARPESISTMVDDGASAMGDSGTLIHSEGIYTWTQARLRKALDRFVLQMSSDLSLCFFIDGLDECTDKIHSLLEVLYFLQGAPRVKICVSSRPEQFVLDFHDALQLMLQRFQPERHRENS